MKLFKKNEKKAATKLSMTGKVRKGFRFYCLAVMAVTFMLGTSVTAFAANAHSGREQPFRFHFRSGKGCRYDYAWLRYRAGGLVAEIP